ncbi:MULTISPECIES: SufD family Fe-S cluster assembly protein [unclassified Stygiolobus]|uniref:SufD family Fe-S cluster assembly protein n=1 Tax=unclassified Stygiolobus TaxID=2824672 RepID=UPI00307D3A01
MSIIDFSSAQQYISKFSNKSERERLLSLYLSLPYQRINDSPTLKHYTDWSRFEKLNLQVNDFLPSKEGRKIDGYTEITYPSEIETKDEPTNSLIKAEEHKLVSLTLALSNKITISSSNLKSKKILFYHTSSEGVFYPLNLEVKVEDGDTMDFVYMSDSPKDGMTSSVISFEVGRDAQLNLTIIGLSSNLFIYSKALVKGELNTNIFTSRSFISHVSYSIELMENAISTFSAKTIGLNDDNINVRVSAIHKGKRSKSDGMLKAISTDSALSVIGGDATVSEEALDSSTSIIGRAYNIGKDSKAVVAPMLEVKTGRVQLAKHSASISRVPDELIFYLETRGFSRKEAESMIIKGFIIDENDPPFLEKIIDEILTEAKVLVSV